MQLDPGTRLGPYEIAASAGAGGMGEVYRARDTRLDRTVAIKVLSRSLGEHPELIQRFEREARAISSLNNPHICALYDIGENNGVQYLVMEFLEGETLADRLLRGPLPLDEVWTIAAQIGSALDQAHRRGIVHRDLKPGNIMITGPKAAPFAKLLDFGLAKVTQPQSTAAADATALLTVAQPLTTQGSIIGTFQYMPPEQLEGRETDARSDIFAFGAVLYEMITGRRAFQGGSQASLISSIMTSTPPPVTSIQPSCPPAVERVIGKCLAKDPDDRWQSARDLTSELKWIADHPEQAAQVAAVPQPSRRTANIVIAALALATAALAVVAVRHTIEKPTPPPVVRFTIAEPPANSAISAVSPDGQSIVFRAARPGSRPMLYLRRLDSDSRQLAGTEGAYFPFWSPDSRNIGYFAQAKLNRLELASGGIQTICDLRTFGQGGTWNRDGVILFTPSPEEPIYRVNASGGTAAKVTAIDTTRQQRTHAFPQFLPDGNHFLFWVNSLSQENGGVFAGSLDGSPPVRLLASESQAAYDNSGHLLFTRRGTLMAQPFDAANLRLSGEPFSVAERIGRSFQGVYSAFSVAGNTLVYHTEVPQSGNRLTWFDRQGKVLGTIGDAGDYSNPALSPDGRTLAVCRRDSSNLRDIWLIDLARGTNSRFTFDGGDDFNPVWSPDGKRIAFSSSRMRQRDLFVKDSGGAGQDELLIASDLEKNVEDWSPDGKFLLFNHVVPGPRELWVLPMTGERKPVVAVKGITGNGVQQAAFSPDGRYIAYTSSESGRPEVYVQTFPAGGGKWQVSNNTGTEPRWRADGKELYYTTGGTITAVEVKAGGSRFEAGSPRTLFAAQLNIGGRNRYIVTPDGKRFLAIVRGEEAPAPPMNVVVNWFSAAKR